MAPGGRTILVHYTGETYYRHTGDEADGTLWRDLEGDFVVEKAERHDRCRLDLWRR